LTPVLTVLRTFVTLVDRYQVNRIEWIFGLPDHDIKESKTARHTEYVLSTFAAGIKRCDSVSDHVNKYYTSVFKQGS
jgi:hypothetical protein